MRRSAASLLVVAAIATAALASGQAKKGGAGRGKPKPAASAATKSAPAPDNPYDEPATAPAKSATPSADAGVTAPAETTSADAGSASGSAAPAASSAAGGTTRVSPLTPRPEELPDGGAPATPADIDKLLGDIAALRARVAAVSDTLFHSRIVVRVETRGDHAKVARLVVTLDDGVVYTAPAGFRAEDEATIYDHAVAPGKHLLGVEVERRDDRGDGYRAGQTSRFTLDVPENQRLEATVRLDDDSDMASDFPSSRKGSYDVRVRVRARAKK